jgi:hypothetical protein
MTSFSSPPRDTKTNQQTVSLFHSPHEEQQNNTVHSTIKAQRAKSEQQEDRGAKEEAAAEEAAARKQGLRLEAKDQETRGTRGP